jgi:hypothetical protein
MQLKWNDQTRLVAALALSAVVLIVYSVFLAPKPDPAEPTAQQATQTANQNTGEPTAVGGTGPTRQACGT